MVLPEFEIQETLLYALRNWVGTVEIYGTVLTTFGNAFVSTNTVNRAMKSSESEVLDLDEENMLGHLLVFKTNFFFGLISRQTRNQLLYNYAKEIGVGQSTMSCSLKKLRFTKKNVLPKWLLGRLSKCASPFAHFCLYSIYSCLFWTK